MASLLKSKNKSSISNSTLTGGLVTGAAVLAFFLLPELLSLFGDNPSQTIETEEAGPLVVAAKASPTPQVDELLGSTPEPQKVVVEEAPVAEEPEQRKIKTVADVDRELARVKSEVSTAEEEQKDVLPACVPVSQEEKKTEKTLIPLEGPIQWKDLQTEEVKQLIEKAKANSTDILAQINPEKDIARFEMVSFINSLNDLSGALASDPNALGFSPENALKFIDYRDVAVSKAMEVSGVHRSIMKKWQDTSLGAIIREAMSARIKEKLLKPFRPKMVITDAVFRYDWGTQVQKYPQRPLRVQMKGYILGDETKSLEWFASNNPKGIFPVHLEDPDSKGRRFFELPFRDDVKRNAINIVATATDGSKFMKEYNFYPKVRSLPAVNMQGEVFLRLPYRPFDPRIDRTFLVKQANVKEDGSLVEGSFNASPLVQF